MEGRNQIPGRHGSGAYLEKIGGLACVISSDSQLDSSG